MLPSTLKTGTMFGQDFEILHRLAQGGMGTVYVALQHSTGKKRALKVMHAQYEGDDIARRRFIQEARAGAAIDSDHIVEMVGAGIDPETNTPWIAMELLKGDDLKAVLQQRKRLPPGEVREIFRQICHALGKAHKMGLVHRDLKPENIFLATPRREGIAFTAKILDFGIAKLVRDGANTSGTQTQAIGSPRWMSPEQADRGNAPISPATDVWALGLIAFNLLTGEVYWKTAHAESPSVIAQMCEILMDPIVAPSIRAAEYGVADLLPEGFDEWFLRCVNREPSTRFPDADEALAEFDPLFEGVEAPAVSRVTRASTPARGVSVRPPPVAAPPSSPPAAPSPTPTPPAANHYTLDLASASGEQPFSLDRTLPADTGRVPRVPTPPPPANVPTPATPASLTGPTGAPPKRNLAPIVLAVLGPLGIAAAVMIGLHRTPAVTAEDAGVAHAPEAAVAVAAPDVTAPQPPPQPAPDAAPAVAVPTPAHAVDASVAVNAPTPAGARDAGARHGRNARNGEDDAGADPTDPISGDTQAYTERVMASFRARNGDFVRCYEEHGSPTANPNLRVTMHFSLRPDGSVSGVGVSAPGEVAGCIRDIISAMTFPTPVAATGPFFRELNFHSQAAPPPAANPPPSETPPASP